MAVFPLERRLMFRANSFPHFYFPIVFFSLTLGGCASRTMYDAGAAAAGGGIGYLASDGNPFITAGSAAAGVVLSETLQGAAKKGQATQYNKGYDRGASDATKQLYWASQRIKSASSVEEQPRPARYAFPVEPNDKAKIKEVTHERVMQVTE
jgi:hypothetical protein